MKTLQPKFFEFIPKELEDGIIYITMHYRTAIHLCPCGCGNKVVTRFSPRDWTLIFDGNTVSLSPSVGNWNFDCRSHYWIRNNEIHMAATWSESKIKASRRRNAKGKPKK
jgi:hypothetical protein